MVNVQAARKRRTTSLRGPAPVPTWMQDRALLLSFHRQSLKDLNFPTLSPGTKRLRTVLEVALAELEARLERAKDQPIPF